jgi:hypothetical protein
MLIKIMSQDEIIDSVRAEIAKLQGVLALLLGQSSGAQEVRRPGRPKGSSKKTAKVHQEASAPKKRVMSAEGKARIAAAQRKRWAAQKETPPRSASKKTGSSKRASKTAPAKSSSKTAKKRTRTAKGTGSAQAVSA